MRLKKTLFSALLMAILVIPAGASADNLGFNTTILGQARQNQGNQNEVPLNGYLGLAYERPAWNLSAETDMRFFRDMARSWDDYDLYQAVVHIKPSNIVQIDFGRQFLSQGFSTDLVDGLKLTLREKRPPDLVLDAGQRRLFLTPLARAEGNDPLLRAERPLPLPVGHGEIPQGAQRGQMVVVPRQQALEQGHGLPGAARPPEVLRGREHELGPLLAPERVQVVDKRPLGVAALERELAQPRVRLRVVGIPLQQRFVDLHSRLGAARQLGVHAAVVDIPEGFGAPGLSRALVVAVGAPKVADDAKEQSQHRARQERTDDQRRQRHIPDPVGGESDADAGGVQRGEVCDGGAEGEGEQDAEADGHGWRASAGATRRRCALLLR